MRVLLWVLLFGSCFAGQRPYVLLLDAGHGGRDPGAIGYLGMKEKDLCLLFVRDLAVALKRYPD
ncbi:MAG: N-acetylmuramoyl-L-alanine amidase, partial [Pseudomonadota bacterium]|nr:N-acetylmuramoyl-L-alanine amidase [Pseudomonadota bacterium]